VKLIPLTHGYYAKVDDADYVLLSGFSWHYIISGRASTGYARTTMAVDGKKKKVRMHRFILGEPANLVDHRDGDGLNNQRHNLREATRGQNKMNSRKSTLKGVRFRPTNQKWEARITLNKVVMQIGQFSSETLAAFAYDRKARELFGEFACPNFHPDCEGAYWDFIYDTL